MKRKWTVDVWAGNFSSRERMDAYLEETYDDDDSTPVSEFAGDMNEFFYDHDFFETSFCEGATEDVGALLRAHSPDSSWIELAVSAFQSAPEPVNAVLWMENEDDYFQIAKPVSIMKEGVRLRYLGRFGSDLQK